MLTSDSVRVGSGYNPVRKRRIDTAETTTIAEHPETAAEKFPPAGRLSKAGRAMRGTVAEAGGHFEDIVAEVRAESRHAGNGAHLAAEPEAASAETQKRSRRQTQPPGSSSHQ